MARHKKKNKGVGLMCLLTVCATLLLCAGGYLAVSLFQGDAAPSVILMEKQNRDVVSLPPMTLKPARTPEPTPEPTWSRFGQRNQLRNPRPAPRRTWTLPCALWGTSCAMIARSERQSARAAMI